jgi:hypothetical protein
MIARHWNFVFRLVTLMLAAAGVTGCQISRLEQNTVAMNGQLSDFQYGQVMNNLAAVADDSNALPHFIVADSGKTLIQSQDSVGVGFFWSAINIATTLAGKTLFSNVNPSIQYLEQDQYEWDGQPATDPVQELLMQGCSVDILSRLDSCEEHDVMGKDS